MREFKVNENCIIGLPSCGYGFQSSRMCFLARPADDDFQLEQDILETLLQERNYDLYAALGNIDPGNFAFCTKICSKIITSHFCIVLLNESRHAVHPEISISNPNVHFEYGMMLSFHKHVIPMQREGQQLPFNIYPLDTIKYTPGNFKEKAKIAIEDAILRYTTKEPPGRPVGAASEVLKFFGLRGMRYTDTSGGDAAVVYRLGSGYGFNLFDGPDGIIFFGYFHEEEPKDIVMNTRFLLTEIDTAYKRVGGATPMLGGHDLSEEQQKVALKLLGQISVVLLVPEDAPIDHMKTVVSGFMPDAREVGVEMLRPSEISKAVTEEYEKLDF